MPSLTKLFVHFHSILLAHDRVQYLSFIIFLLRYNNQTTFSFYDSFVSDTNCSLMIIQQIALHASPLFEIVVTSGFINDYVSRGENKTTQTLFFFLRRSPQKQRQLIPCRCFESFFNIVLKGEKLSRFINQPKSPHHKSQFSRDTKSHKNVRTNVTLIFIHDLCFVFCLVIGGWSLILHKQRSQGRHLKRCNISTWTLVISCVCW